MTTSIVRTFFETAERFANRPALAHKRAGQWHETAWRDYAESVRRIARGFIALGVEPGDTVAVVGNNCPEWLIADLAVMAAGGVPVPLYTSCTAEQAGYILDHSRAAVLVADDAEQLDKIAGTVELRHTVQMRGAAAAPALGWQALAERGDGIDPVQLEERLARLEPDGLATLIYTSGTTGHPKGVMLSHRNLSFTAAAAVHMLGLTEAESLVSYLPLSHIAEQMLSIHAPATCGYRVAFAESLEALADNLREVRPTLFVGVPRVWEKIEAKMKAAGSSRPAPMRWLASWARAQGRAHIDRSPERAPTLRYRLAKRLVFSRVRERLGLDRARLCSTTAAPIGRSTLEFFASLGVPLYEIYGMTEVTGPGTISTLDGCRLGSAGRALRGTELTIAADGEILMRGDHVCMGYYRDEAATRAAIDPDGWLHSGDIGSLDDGFLRVTDRKKDLIITAGGKNIAPQNIEAMLKQIPGIGQACVVGDRLKHLSALLTIDREQAADVARACDAATSEPAALAADASFQGFVRSHLDEVNRRLSRVETIKRFTLLPNEFSVESGELTPTLKMKRNVVQERYRDQILAMYAEEERDALTASS